MIGLAKLAPGEGNVDLAERPERAPGPGEVTVAVAAAGVCGTDLHIWLGEYASEPPVTMGHEVCGRVVELGEGVDPAWRDARVAVETFFSTCGQCRYCRAGRLSVCEQRRSIGTHVDGGFAPRLVLPAANLHRVPDGLSDPAAALAEPVACVCNSLLDLGPDPPILAAPRHRGSPPDADRPRSKGVHPEDARPIDPGGAHGAEASTMIGGSGPSAVQPGDEVLVIGPGAIGLVAAQVARACGGAVIVRGTERDGPRLALAGELGFRTSVAGREEPPPADVVVECSGSAAGIADALRTVRRRGRLVQMGLRGADVTIPYDLICFHELTVTAGFASNPGSWRRAMALLPDIELAPLVTEVMPLAEWRRAFEASRAGEGVKYVIDPRR